MDIRILKLKVTNCYLVRADRHYLLVDTGYEYEWALFCQRLQEAGVSVDQIGYVLLTHHHDDHAGLLNSIVECNPNVRVIVSARGTKILATGQHFHTAEAGYINRRIGFLLSLKGRIDKKCTFRRKRSLIPADADHAIRRKPITQSAGWRSAGPQALRRGAKRRG